MLTKHLPWHGKFDLLQKIQASSFLELFEKIISSPLCPIEIILPYKRAEEHHYNRFHEVTSKNEIIDCNSFSSKVSAETRTLVTLCNIVTAKRNITDDYDNLFDYGVNYDWSGKTTIWHVKNHKL